MPGFNPDSWNAFLTDGSAPDRRRSPWATAAMRRLASGDYANFQDNLSGDDYADLEQYSASLPEKTGSDSWYIDDNGKRVTLSSGHTGQSTYVDPSSGRTINLGEKKKRAQYFTQEDLGKARSMGYERRAKIAAAIKKQQDIDDAALAQQKADSEESTRQKKAQFDADLTAKSPQGRLTNVAADAKIAEMQAADADRKAGESPYSASENIGILGYDIPEYEALRAQKLSPTMARGKVLASRAEKDRRASEIVGSKLTSNNLTPDDIAKLESDLAAAGLQMPSAYSKIIKDRSSQYAQNAKTADDRAFREAMQQVDAEVRAMTDSMSSNWFYLSDDDKNRIREIGMSVIQKIDAMPIKQLVKDNLKATIRERLMAGAKTSSTWAGDFGITEGRHVGEHTRNVPWYLGQ